MTSRVAIVGAGNIGWRHLEAMTKSARPLALYVIDPSPAARARIGGLLAEGPAHGHEVSVLAACDGLPREIDCAIVATTAGVRRAAVEALLSATRVACLLLEKFLFQRREDYAAVGRMLEERGVRAWVNCPRRVWPGYVALRQAVRGRGPLMCRASSALRSPIATSAIHVLDLFAFLGGALPLDYRASRLRVEENASRHPGLMEFSGLMHGVADDGSTFEYVCFRRPAGPLMVEVMTPSVRMVIRESDQVAWRAAEEEGWAWREVPFPVPLQSQVSLPIVESIIDEGTCGLPTLAESQALHLDMLDLFLAALRAQAGHKDDTCPVT